MKYFMRSFSFQSITSLCICWGTIKPWSNWNMEKTNRFNNTGRIWPDRNGMSIMVARRTILPLTRVPYPLNRKRSIPSCLGILNFQTEPNGSYIKNVFTILSSICDDVFAKLTHLFSMHPFPIPWKQKTVRYILPVSNKIATSVDVVPFILI